MKKSTVVVWTRLTEAEKAELERIAASEDRSLASVTARLIRQSLAGGKQKKAATR